MKRLSVAIALGAAAISAPAPAQMPGARGGLGQRDQTRDEAKQRADMLFQMLDTNRDGVVSRQEAEAALARIEASRGEGESGRGGGMVQRMLDRVFAGSSSVTQQQFEALMLARFDAQDLNHDGVVTAEERQQARHRPGAAAVPGTTPAPPAGAVPPPPQ